MKQYLRDNAKVVGGMFIALLILGFLTYSFVAPGGMFSGLQNDLKAIETEAGVSYTDLDGVSVDLDELKGKPLIINSWATWMPFSKDELNLLAELKNSYGDRVEVVAMNRMEEVGTVRAYLATYGIPETLRFLLDPADSFYKAVGGYAMPETLFYRSDGTLFTHKRGVLTREELEGYVGALVE